MSDQLASIQGNDSIKEYLKRLAINGNVPHSMLFAGPKSSQKEDFAEAFAALLVKDEITDHPDVHLFKPEGKLGIHSVDGIRFLKEEAYLPPYQASKKVFIIYEADRMLPYSANALLKIFEEPPTHNTIILISTHPEKLLSTILSRCHLVRFQGPASYQLPIHPLLCSLLSQRKTTSYHQLAKAIKALVKEVEAESSTQTETSKELTAFQIQQIEKQSDGANAIQSYLAAEALFEQILGWFRDMYLLHYNSCPALLYHKEQEGEVRMACDRGEFEDLDKIQTIIQDAKLALERSTPLSIVLENLFLKL
ncbi:MAG: ATP-binding protein [Parachlamydiaceae bacterium]